MTIQPTNLQGPLASHFGVGGEIVTTGSASVFKAQEPSSGDMVALWMLKPPAPGSDEEIEARLRWLSKFAASSSAACRVKGFGRDSENTIYLIASKLDGESLGGKGKLGAKEAERRFITAARLLGKLHKKGVSFGDLGPDSFWVSRSGSAEIVGAFGGDARTASRCSSVEKLFLSPEVVNGQEVTPASDVYSLGMLLLHLFSGSVEVSQDGPVKFSDFVDVPPTWADEVFARCTAADRSERYQEAKELLDAIADIRKRGASAELAPSLTSGGGVQDSQGSTGPKVLFHQPVGAAASQSGEEGAPAPEESKGGTPLALIGGGIGAALVAVGLVVYFATGSGARQPTSAAPKDGGAGGLFSAPSVSSETLASIERIGNSDDPAGFARLVNDVVAADSFQLRSAIEAALVSRVNRGGFELTSGQLKQFFTRARAKDNPPGYEAIIKASEPDIPIGEQSSFLRQAYPSDSQTVLRLVAARALDSGKPEAYREILSQLIGDSLQLEDTDVYSPAGLMLVHEDLALLFSEGLLSLQSTLRDEELPILLSTLASREDPNLRSLVKIILERGGVDPVRAVFLEIIRDRRDITPAVLLALSKSAAGDVQEEDLVAFGRWYDVDASKALLAVLATSTDKGVIEEAIDLLAGKGVTEEPAATFLDFVKRNYWDKRGELGSLVGVFAYLDRLSTEQIGKALTKLSKYSGDPELINRLLDSRDPAVVPEIIQRYGAYIDLGKKLELIASPVKGIRQAAVESIETNDVGALKIIMDQYDKEDDPEVKQAYQKFWMIRERGQ